MPIWAANNVVSRRDYLVGVPLLLCALTLPFLERPGAVSGWTIWLVACYTFLLSMVIFYRPAALVWTPLVALSAGLPDGFSSGMIRDGGDWVLCGWRWCWYGLAAAVWLRWLSTRRNEARQLWSDPTEGQNERDAAPRLSRPLRVLLYGAVCVPLFLFVVVGLDRARCNAALLDQVRRQTPCLVNFWLARGANPTAITSGDMRKSALEIAIGNNDPETVKALCVAGAPADKDFTGRGVPLTQALRMRQEGNEMQRLEVVCLLLSHGARANAPDREGRFPIMLVGEYRPHLSDNDLEIVGRLVGAGANLNARDRSGNTLLMQRLKNGDFDPRTYSTLMAMGANSTLENKRGETFQALLTSDFQDNLAHSHTLNGRRKRTDERTTIFHLLQTAANPLMPPVF